MGSVTLDHGSKLAGDRRSRRLFGTVTRREAAVALAAGVPSLGFAALALARAQSPLEVAAWVLPLSAFVIVGAITTRRRPDSWLGPMMAAVGVLSCIPLLKGSAGALAFTAGYLLDFLWAAALVHLLFAFPDGRVTRGLERWLLFASYSAVAFGALRLTIAGPDGTDSSNDLLLISSHPGIAGALTLAQTLVGVTVACGVVAVLLARWHGASPVQRRSAAPILWCGAVTVLAIAYLVLVTGAGVGAWSPLADWALTILLASVPVAYLAGLLRSRFYRVTAITNVLARLERIPDADRLRSAIAAGLGDEGLQVVYWLPESRSYVDADGHPSEPDASQAVTEIENDDGPVAALVHDASLSDDRELLRDITSTAAVWLDNVRLQIALRSRIEALRESRARLVHAADSERRRIERDLHDGAQQRLAALSLQIALQRPHLAVDAPARELLDGVQASLGEAIVELRALAAGILPPVLTDRGLPAAVRELAGRSPLAVSVNDALDQRLPVHVEVAAYFVVAEALANVVKHAQAGEAHVGMACAAGWLHVEVGDDGRGGVDIAAGTGLRGLADRVGALNGRLSVASSPRLGTTIAAELPCAS